MSNEIKCPICGGEITSSHSMIRWHYYCVSCGLDVSFSTDECSTEAEAIAAWKLTTRAIATWKLTAKANVKQSI